MKKMNKKFVITTISLILIITLSLIAANSLNNIRLENIKRNAEIKKKNSNIIEIKNEFNEVVGNYQCQKNNCSFITTISDKVETFESLDSEEKVYNKLINNRYVFIYDYNDEKEKKVIIYDIINKKTIMEVDAIKNYNVDLEDNYFIYENNSKFGLMQLKDKLSITIKPSYDYLSLANKVDSSKNKLIVDKLVAKNDNKWKIIDLKGSELSLLYDNPIVNYNGLYIITLDNNYYKLSNYDGKTFFDNNHFQYISFTAKYVNLVENGYLRVVDPVTSKVIASNIKLASNEYKNGKSFTTKIENNKLIITVINGNDNKEYTFKL